MYNNDKNSDIPDNARIFFLNLILNENIDGIFIFIKTYPFILTTNILDICEKHINYLEIIKDIYDSDLFNEMSDDVKKKISTTIIEHDKNNIITKNNDMLYKVKELLIGGFSSGSFSLQDIELIKEEMQKDEQWFLDNYKEFHGTIFSLYPSMFLDKIEYTEQQIIDSIFVRKQIIHSGKWFLLKDIMSTSMIEDIFLYIPEKHFYDLLMNLDNNVNIDIITKIKECSLVQLDNYVYNAYATNNYIPKIYLIEFLFMFNDYNLLNEYFYIHFSNLVKNSYKLIFNSLKYYLEKVSDMLINKYHNWFANVIIETHHLLNKQNYKIKERLLAISDSYMLKQFYSDIALLTS